MLFGGRTRRTRGTTTAATATGRKPSLLTRLTRPAGTRRSNRLNTGTATTGATTRGWRGTRRSKLNNRTVATGPMPMSHHQSRPSLGVRLHGVARKLAGKLTGRRGKVASGDRMMHGKTIAGTTRTHHI